MCKSSSKNKARQVLNETSNGTHFIELHFPSMGASLAIIVIIVLLLIGLWWLGKKACGRRNRHFVPIQSLPMQNMQQYQPPVLQPPFFPPYQPYPLAPTAALPALPTPRPAITKEDLQEALQALSAQNTPSTPREETAVKTMGRMARRAVRLNAKPAIVEELPMDQSEAPNNGKQWLSNKIGEFRPTRDPNNSAMDGVKRLKQELGL